MCVRVCVRACVRVCVDFRNSSGCVGRFPSSFALSFYDFQIEFLDDGAYCLSPTENNRMVRPDSIVREEK